MQNSSTTASSGWTPLRYCVVGLAGFVTLIALFYAEEDLRGRLAWSSYQREAARKGIELNPHAYFPAPVPDDQNFAMTPLLVPVLDMNPRPLKPGQTLWRDPEAHERVLKIGNDFNTVLSSAGTEHKNREEPWLNLGAMARALQKNSPSSTPLDTRSQAAGEILRSFKTYHPMLDELRTASQRPYSRFNVDYEAEDPSGILLPHLGLLRRVSQILEYRASAELALGHKDAALDDLQLMLSLGDAFHNEPFVISQLVRIAIFNEARQILWEGLAGHAWSDAQLRGLQDRFEKLTLLKDANTSLRSEQATMGTTFFDFLRSNPMEAARSMSWGKGNAQLLRWAPTGWSYLEQVNYQRIYSGQFENVYDEKTRRVHPKFLTTNLRQMEKLYNVNPVLAVLHHRVLAAMLTPALAGAFQKAAAAQTTTDECTVACALERYCMTSGQYPGTLAELVPQYLAAVPNDVITGEPLKYRPDGAQFALYSVGWNETDDGGTEPPGTNSRDLTKGDWCWTPYPQK